VWSAKEHVSMYTDASTKKHSLKLAGTKKRYKKNSAQRTPTTLLDLLGYVHAEFSVALAAYLGLRLAYINHTAISSAWPACWANRSDQVRNKRERRLEDQITARLPAPAWKRAAEALPLGRR
jgi:hypothetical protein